ncbi:uncharacterized protein [Haliotis asinina]|uniref:uncharacterized protein n=1 Tax=Haliotis asinina TaxID=109174 RepID=UPI003531F0E7
MTTVGVKDSTFICCLLSFCLAEGTDYLMTSPSPDFHIQAVSGSQWGTYSITYPGQPPLEYSSPPWSSNSLNVDANMAVVSGTENKSFIVSVSDNSAMRVYGRDANDAYTPLPIPALGRHYVFSNCHGFVNTTTVLTIATHGHETTVHITFKAQTNITISGLTYNNEEMLSLNLGEYQTFTLHSDTDLTGTWITSGDPIAVYAGTRSSGIISTYDQLLPVKHLGKVYVIPQRENANQNTVIFTSVSNVTSIDIKGGLVLSLSFTRSFSLGGLYSDGALIVNASKPVLLTLCRGGELSSKGFCVVPPVSLLPRRTYLPLEGEYLKVVAEDTTSTVLATALGGTMSVQWKMVQNSSYSIGTLNTSFFPSSSFSITSMGGLVVYVFSDVHLYTGGYHFPFEDAALTSTAPPQAVTTSSTSFADTSPNLLTSSSKGSERGPISSMRTGHRSQQSLEFERNNYALFRSESN